jgi:hypothetical protein
LFSLPPRPSSNRLRQQPDFVSTVTAVAQALTAERAMKTKYVIQFRSGPLKGQFVGRWSEHGWVFLNVCDVAVFVGTMSIFAAVSSCRVSKQDVSELSWLFASISFSP